MKQRIAMLPLALLALCLVMPEQALAAGGEENKWGILLWIGRFFNLAVVVAILVYVGRKPLAGFFENRSRSIREQLAEAQKARTEAEEKLADVESRMSRLDEELKELKQSAEAEAEQERRRLLSEAEQDARKIADRARQEIEGMTRAAQVQLKAHVAELSVQLAEEQIKREIRDEDQSRLFSRFVARIGGDE